MYEEDGGVGVQGLQQGGQEGGGGQVAPQGGGGALGVDKGEGHLLLPPAQCSVGGVESLQLGSPRVSWKTW